ncbi:MAG: hypothetical protein NZM06_01470 [Chloroherpetonaceae bacterium]|nr:hypothetical protein [Chloroherpetonaceae bacterium]MDW8436666.1 hypothetical protein [Chloroherpetonaceae bacterium]
MLHRREKVSFDGAKVTLVRRFSIRKAWIPALGLENVRNDEEKLGTTRQKGYACDSALSVE